MGTLREKRLYPAGVLILLLSGGFLFRTYLLDNFFHPLAMILWLFLRVTFLSIDQIQLWDMTLILTVFILFFSAKHFIPEPEPREEGQKNYYRWELEQWDSALEGVVKESPFSKSSREQMASLLVSLEEAETGGGTPFVILDEYRRGQRGLPPRVYSLLFEKPVAAKGIGRWFPSLEKRNRRERERMVREYLVYLEKGAGIYGKDS